MKEIIEVLQEIIRDNFDDETIVIQEKMAFEDLQEWDSMEQVNVITMVEGHYNFKFNMAEMTAMSNAQIVEEMAEVINKKLLQA